MARSKKEDMDALLRTARKRYSIGIDSDWDNIEQALDDLKFAVGEQWDEALRREREADDKPCLTINRMRQFIRQVTGDMRHNRPTIRVVPEDDEGDVDKADIFAGLVRDIEYKSNATNVYVAAGEAAVACGMGHWRVNLAYQDQSSLDMAPVIKSIPNPLAVVWDPNSKLPTREDAMWCFVVEPMTHEAFKDAYPDATVTDFDTSNIPDDASRWVGTDMVQVAEYYVKKPVKKTFAEMQDGSVIDVTDMDKSQKLFLPIKREVERDCYTVERYLLNGVEVLEGPEVLPTQYIPIITVCGEVTYIGDRIVRTGLIRYSKDAQRMYNYWRSVQIESVQLQTKAPFMATMTQIENYLPYWQNANKANYAFLPYDTDESAPPPQRVAPPVSSSGMGQEIALAAEDMKATTGIYDAALGAKSNETSGVAIEARQREADVGSATFFDNLALGILHTGRILVEMIPQVYTGERVIRLLNEDGSEAWEQINRQVTINGELVVLNDLSVGRYDVRVTTGPSYTTRRLEAADAMLKFAQAVPNSGALIGDLIAQSQDWPKADMIAERLRKALPPGFAEDEEDGQQQQAQQAQPDPAFIENMAKMAKVEADVEKTKAETEAVRLENAQKAAELAVVNGQMGQLVEQIVAQVLQGIAQASLQAPQQQQIPLQ